MSIPTFIPLPPKQPYHSVRLFYHLHYILQPFLSSPSLRAYRDSSTSTSTSTTDSLILETAKNSQHTLHTHRQSGLDLLSVRL